MHTSVSLVKFLAAHFFAKRSEQVHPKVLSKLKGRKKKNEASRSARSNTVS